MQRLGTFEQLQTSGLDFAKLLNQSAMENSKEEVSTYAPPFAATSRRSSMHRQTSIQSVNSIEDKTIEAPAEVEEQKSSGSVGCYVYKSYLKAGGNCCVVFNVLMLFVVTQFLASAGDYFITYW